MQVNFKILLLSFILVLFLAPGMALACGKKQQHVLKPQIQSKTFLKRSFAQTEEGCRGGECIKECCHPKSHECGTDGCSGSCSGNLCSTVQYIVLSEIRFLSDFLNGFAWLAPDNSQFYYRNPVYSSGFHRIWQPPKIG